jgi:hypothetical protein
MWLIDNLVIIASVSKAVNLKNLNSILIILTLDMVYNSTIFDYVPVYEHLQYLCSDLIIAKYNLKMFHDSTFLA